MSLRVCLGCGRHRFDGYVHVDMNPEVKPDVVEDIIRYVYHLEDNVVGNVIAWHVLEHLTWMEVQRLIKHLHRASKPGATWNIRVPHCTSIHAANPQHVTEFSTTFWDFWAPVDTLTGERYGDSRLTVKRCLLKVLASETGLVPRWMAAMMPNWIFNSFGRGWQMLCERLWPWRFDEIERELEVDK